MSEKRKREDIIEWDLDCIEEYDDFDYEDDAEPVMEAPDTGYYSFLVQYLSVPNSCEIDNGQEVFAIRAETEEEASRVATMKLEMKGYSKSEYNILGILNDNVQYVDEFWQKLEYQQHVETAQDIELGELEREAEKLLEEESEGE